MNISVASATEFNFCDLTFFGFNVLSVSRSKTLIIHGKTISVALTQVLKIWLINVRETLNWSAMSSFRGPRRIFTSVIKNSSCLQAGLFFLLKFDLISPLLGFLVDFAPGNFHSANGEMKSHKFKNVYNSGIPV